MRARIGIIRKVDDLGRVVIPMEVIKTLGYSNKESVAITLENEEVVVTKQTGKVNGLTRKLDKLNRIVIPIELKRYLGIENGETLMEFFVDDEKIILREHSVSCVFCGSTDVAISHMGKCVCSFCRGAIRG